VPEVEAIDGEALNTVIGTGTEIALARCTTSCWVEFMAASYGTITLMMLPAAYSKGSGSELPDRTTLVEPSDVGSGKPAESGLSARPDPKIDTSKPTAGALAKSTELTTPPAVTTGTVGFDSVRPVTCTLPLSGACSASARTASPAVLFCGTQVPAQFPLPVESRLMGESPSVKLTVTDPVLNAFPQLSTTSTTIGVGQATGALKPIPIVVNTGSSLFGMQVAGAVSGLNSGLALAVPGVAESTRSNWIA